ncbi:hypothetical protein LCGC14_2657650 [marine sediment metagenome]|uniref:Uncharacterized protein n=1 Tax=marine sediment metagenome TaxID=412755 RepID=A0A0F9AF88_9ZZZZ
MRQEADPRHLVNALISFIAMVSCVIIAGELFDDVLNDDENFDSVPDPLKALALFVFLAFATMEGNKVRSRLTRARGFNGRRKAER